jgi:hypothetical protein
MAIKVYPCMIASWNMNNNVCENHYTTCIITKLRHTYTTTLAMEASFIKLGQQVPPFSPYTLICSAVFSKEPQNSLLFDPHDDVCPGGNSTLMLKLFGREPV